MKVSPDPVSAITVRHVEHGAITIGDAVIKENVVLLRDQILPGWNASDPNALTIDDFENALAYQPEMTCSAGG